MIVFVAIEEGGSTCEVTTHVRAVFSSQELADKYVARMREEKDFASMIGWGSEWWIEEHEIDGVRA